MWSTDRKSRLTTRTSAWFCWIKATLKHGIDTHISIFCWISFIGVFFWHYIKSRKMNFPQVKSSILKKAQLWTHDISLFNISIIPLQSAITWPITFVVLRAAIEPFVSANQQPQHHVTLGTSVFDPWRSTNPGSRTTEVEIVQMALRSGGPGLTWKA